MELVAVAKSGVHIYRFDADEASPVGIGSQVRVKSSVATPLHGWQGIRHQSVGVIKEVFQSECLVGFPENEEWEGILDELEDAQPKGIRFNEPTHSFDAVSTAEGCSWSPDGSLLGCVNPSTGGVVVYNPAADYERLCEVPPLIGGPIRNFYFSPLGTHLVTHERWLKDAGDNVGVWDAKTGEKTFSFILKKLTDMTWPPLKWTSLETHCCRMVSDGVVIKPGSLERGGNEGKIAAPGIMAFEVAPRGAGTGPPHIAVVVGESKGAPAKCQIMRLDESLRVTATKVFYKAQTVSMMWNNLGTAVLVKTMQEVDDTGKSYYGGAHLYFLRADGEESCVIATPSDGAIHDVAWSPTQDEFFMLHGDLPCNMELHEGRKGQKTTDFGRAHRNTVRWNNFGRFLVCGGFGQLLGDTDFWDKTGKKQLGAARLDCCVVSSWSPDGRHFLAATTAPRMRMDNKIVIYDYCAQRMSQAAFEELMDAAWRPRPRGTFQDRPPSAERAKQAVAPKAGAKPGSAAAAKPAAKQAYRPPGARGGGGLAEQLRKELGSTQVQSSTTATKVGQGQQHRLPPGMAPPEPAKDSSGSGAGVSRNARKKKAKEAAQEAASQAAVGASQAPAEAAASAEEQAAEPAPEAQPTAASGGYPAASGGAKGPTSDNPEVEKKVRALRKKFRDIQKLKETPSDKLDKLQREKIAGEGDLIRQLAELGAEP